MTTPRTSRSSRRAAGALAALAVTLPSWAARADGVSERIEFHMYGRIGVAWNDTGNLIQGKTMNLNERSLGGRFEEGDYLEPTITTHILKPDEDKKDTDTYVDLVLTPSMFVRNGSFLGLFSNNTNETLAIELFQGYLEAGNILVPGLKLWGGARFYRGTDVHIADYFYFNNLSGQGGGIKYKNADLAVIVQTSATDPMYAFDTDGDEVPDAQRMRSVFVGQYMHPLGDTGSSLHFLAEAHHLPSLSRKGLGEIAPADFGWVTGVKLHLDLGNGNFNDASVRYGAGIANGAWRNSQTWQTFGLPAANGLYTNAYGIELVEHFVWNFGDIFSVNGAGMLHFDQGGSDLPSDKIMDFAVMARTFLYAHDQFHLINELSYQGRRNGEGPLGTLVKASIVPTFVPTGQRSVWTRPHLRLIYTAGFYNQAAVDELMSPYLATVGPTKYAHYLGARCEWWF